MFAAQNPKNGFITKDTKSTKKCRIAAKSSNLGQPEHNRKKMNSRKPKTGNDKQDNSLLSGLLFPVSLPFCVIFVLFVVRIDFASEILPEQIATAR